MSPCDALYHPVPPSITHRISKSISNAPLSSFFRAVREPRKPPSNGRFREYGRSLRLVPLPVFKLCLLRAAAYRPVSLSAVLSRELAYFISSSIVAYRWSH